MTLIAHHSERTGAMVGRRQFLLTSGGLLAAGAILPDLQMARAESRTPKRLLYFTKSAGFEHSVVKRPDADTLSYSEKLMVEFGRKHGFDVHCSKDGRLFDADYQQFDAFAFYTSGDLTQPGTDGTPPMSPRGKENLLAAVAAGKGFVGIHPASDTFHGPAGEVDPYIKMVGGEFMGHGRQQESLQRVTSPSFPGVEGLGDGFRMHEEWYAMKNFGDDLHVILVQETEGMVDRDYQRPAFPATWARMHDSGHVFYTSMGHREDVWTNPIFESVLIGGLMWCWGDRQAEVPVNVAEVTPGANQLG